MNPFLAFSPAWPSMSAEHIEPAVQTGIAGAKSSLSTIKEQDRSTLSYRSTFQALDEATRDLDRVWGRVQHLDSVASSEAHRSALNKMLPAVSDFYSSLSLDAQLWAVLKDYSESAEARDLAPVYRRHLAETCEGFLSAGADLPEEEKKQLAALQSKLSVKTQKFSENVLDSTNDWSLLLTDESRLAGLPPSAVEAAREDAAAQGEGTDEQPAYRFTLQFPSFFPVLQYAQDESLRRELWEASQQIGLKEGYDNSELVREIIALRQEKVRLIGYENFADWTTKRRMAKSGKEALAFIEELHNKIKPAFDKECSALEQYKASQSSSTPAALEPWEISYWTEHRRQAEFAFNEEELRPYFPLKGVMSGLFELASTLFDVTITTVPNASIWHPEVLYYHLTDNQSGELLGSFYADWHPRESKRGGAWMNCFEVGCPPTDSTPREPHLGLICGNMTKPVAGRVALMTHNEVLTIFHEFGHLIHQLLSEVKVKALAGTNVAWDFVELPSQLMENFCWNRTSLDLFARHHETGELIPEDLFEKMTASRHYMSATGFMRQLGLAKLDLELHLRPEERFEQSWEELSNDLLAGYQVPLQTPPKSMIRRFSHLFASATGYAAGYYSYKWAEVLDADAFTRFEKEGLLSPEVGSALRAQILSKGNCAPPEELFKNFMGRETDPDALLRREGLLVES